MSHTSEGETIEGEAIKDYGDLLRRTARAAFNRRRATLIAYLNDRVEACDWHGVADAACDLRVLEAKGA